MRRRIFASICVVALVILLLLSACVVGLVYGQATRDGFAALRANLLYLSAGYGEGGQGYLETVQSTPHRITLVAPDGAVLFDSSEDTAALENHASRPEVAQALQSGAGQAERRSTTIGARLLYSASKLPDGNVLRVAMEASSVLSEALWFIPWLLCISLVLVVLAALLARHITARLLAPINNLDLDAPLDADAYDELAPLLRRIAAQQGHIQTQMEELRASRAEFETVAASLSEGLVLLNSKTQVLSINHSARAILDVSQSVEDTPLLLAIARNIDLDDVIKQALAGHSAQTMLHAGGRVYRVSASPTRHQNEVSGAVLLLMDDTDKLEAEERRREFTANVSHELKTPLTSISGYAELIETGIAKRQDVADFAGRIQREAARLIALIDDIIRLSQLDEKSPLLEREALNLVDLAHQVAKDLGPALQEKGIQLDIVAPPGGEAVMLWGVRPLMLEILYNLLDNAIRYSPPAARVRIELENQGAAASIVVADNGPGIAPEHQARVFERFYRVDKSHSKHSGGTGLGLSIVKNGVAYHDGTLSLQSSPGQGSRFTVVLPSAAH